MDIEKKKLKVCVVNPNYYRSSGVTTAIERIFKASSSLAIEWSFVDCKYGKGVEIEDSKVIPKDIISNFRLMSISIVGLLGDLNRFKIFLKTNEIDVVHVHHRRLAWLLGWYFRSLNIPIVYTAQVTYSQNFFFKFLNVSKVVAISNSVKNNVLETINLKPNNLEQIYNPAIFYENSYPLLDNKTKIGCIARFDPVKNHETLIRAWATLSDKNIDAKLLLIGEGKLKNRLETLAKELNVSSSVEFIGYSENVKEYISKCKFMILSSWREGHPLVVIEAAGLRKATLLTDVDGSRDCVPLDSNLPNKVNPRSSEEMAKAIEYWLLSDNALIEEGEKFYRFWKNQASASIVAEKYFNLYQSCKEAN
jgi:glycosyltransferase involved in cell wall biosynthesis